MEHVSLQICERSQERKEQIVVFALLGAEPRALAVPRGGSGNAPLGGWRDAEGVDSNCMERAVGY